MRQRQQSGVTQTPQAVRCQTDDYFVLASLDLLPTNAIAPTHESTQTIPMTGPMCAIESVSMYFLRCFLMLGSCRNVGLT